MTLRESLIRKIKAGWSDNRLRQEYHWISENNFTACLDGAKAQIRREA